jgi:hypothetical protein
MQAPQLFTRTSAISPRRSREFCQSWSASEDQRAQGMPGARCARSLACEIKKHTSVVTTVTPSSPGIPRAMVLTGSFVLSRVTGLFATLVSGVASTNLTPASGRQDHTTSPSASCAVRQQHISVHRIPSRVRDEPRIRPSMGRDGKRNIPVSIWPSSAISEIPKSL